jgi:hypothetical protein
MPPSLLVRRTESSPASPGVFGVVLQHHAILIRLGVDGGDQSLPKGVIQGVIHVRHGDAETAGVSRLTFTYAASPLSCQSLLTSESCGSALAYHQLRHPGAERIQRGGLQRELVLRAADLGINGQILNRLQVKLNARDASDGVCRRSITV